MRHMSVTCAHTGPVMDHVNGFDIIDCHDCGFRHIMPIPHSHDLTDVYEEEYYSLEKPDYIAHYEQDKDWWQLCYDDRYDYFEKILPSTQRKILDVGSGPGLFLLRGKDRGWDAFGIEPSRQAVRYSKNLGLNVHQGFLTSETFFSNPFDVVHMSLVLEHIPDPIALLHKAHALLNPDGLICIVVPNDYNPFQIALRDVDAYPSWWLAPPHHVNYFDHATLKVVLERVGFEIIETQSSFPIDLFLLMGDNYIGDDDLGKQCHHKRKKFEMTLKEAGFNDLRLSLYRQMAQQNIGREVIMYGRRI